MKYDVFVLDGTIKKTENANQARVPDSLTWDKAHRRLGHISVTSLQKILTGKHAIGLNIDDKLPAKIHCDTCR